MPLFAFPGILWTSPPPSCYLAELLLDPFHSLTCILFAVPAEVLPSLLLAKEALQDGVGDGQHHGGGGGVAQPHGQKGGGHHHPQDESGNRGSRKQIQNRGLWSQLPPTPNFLRMES